jgi:5-oxoprolinase (ATP-hydrolysing) subunit C
MTLRVLEAGLYTLVVDFGRPGYRSLGVPLGGAADRVSLAIGNALVGNPPDAAALEISLAGPTLETDCDLACVVYGAPFELTSDRQKLTAGKTFTLRAGEQLRVGGTQEGMRAYLCVRGGLQESEILGSRSSLEPLRAGAELRCSPGAIHARSVRTPFDRNVTTTPLRTLRVLDGPQADWFAAEALFGNRANPAPKRWTVTPASNRMGLRLYGEPLPVPAREMVSEPVCPGAVQVTRDGQCIILGVDGQTIGGYPKVAQVISADLDHLGQLRPGECVAFERVSLGAAERAYRERQRQLKEWLTRLRTAEVFAPAHMPMER